MMPAMPFPAAAARSPERIPVRRTRVRRVLKLLNLSFRVANLSLSALRIFFMSLFRFLEARAAPDRSGLELPTLRVKKNLLDFVFADVEIVVCLCYRRGFQWWRQLLPEKVFRIEVINVLRNAEYFLLGRD